MNNKLPKIENAEQAFKEILRLCTAQKSIEVKTKEMTSKVRHILENPSIGYVIFSSPFEEAKTKLNLIRLFAKDGLRALKKRGK
jgi:hypothetical protein